MQSVTANIDIVGSNTIAYLYDGSKAVDNTDAKHYTILKDLSISDQLFLGDSEDEVWGQDEVVTEIMKYLNLHITQVGFTFYIFDWASVLKGAIAFQDIVTNQKVAITANDITISNDNAADCDTSITIGEVFNQIQLKCDVKSIESIVESPLDSDSIKPAFTSRQLYLTEYSSIGKGSSAYSAFIDTIIGKETDYDAISTTDWYAQIKKNDKWEFYLDMQKIDPYLNGKNQQALLNDMRKGYGATLLSLGKIEKKLNKKDDSPVSKIEMEDYLVISVNGNEVNFPGNGKAPFPNEAFLSGNFPLATYKGGVSGGVFSPSDEETTNYIVISGEVMLNPVAKLTETYKKIKQTVGAKPGTDIIGNPAGYYNFMGDTVDVKNADGRYYTQQYYKAENPTDVAQWDTATDNGLTPYTDQFPEAYEYSYSAIGDGTDKISKVPILACMLVIGDKCVIETGHKGQTTDFKWVKYKSYPECKDSEEYYQQCFTIGFNPKIGDKLIGGRYDIQNNISYTMGLDTEGTAIPIKKADHVAGQVSFKILGIVNATWDEVTRVHPSFWRHTKWGSNTVPLLAHIGSIFIKDFEIEVHSDNGLINNLEDKDLIYTSSTDERFLNKKDDIDFKINSALTLQQRKELGITDGVKYSVPQIIAKEEALLDIYDHNRKETAKPEQFYVDSYYQEYHQARIIMEQNINDNEISISRFTHFLHPALGKKMFVQGIGYNLMDGVVNLSLKEIYD